MVGDLNERQLVRAVSSTDGKICALLEGHTSGYAAAARPKSQLGKGSFQHSPPRPLTLVSLARKFGAVLYLYLILAPLPQLFIMSVAYQSDLLGLECQFYQSCMAVKDMGVDVRKLRESLVSDLVRCVTDYREAPKVIK